jgi:hypothetical protein
LLHPAIGLPDPARIQPLLAARPMIAVLKASPSLTPSPRQRRQRQRDRLFFFGTSGAPSCYVPAIGAPGTGSRPQLASILREGRKSANIHLSSGGIWGIAV